MQMRTLVVGVLLLAVGLGAGCGGDDDPLDPGGIEQQIQRVIDCTEDGLVQVLLSLQNIDAIVDAASTGEVPDGVTILPSMEVGDPPFTYDVTVDYLVGAGPAPDQRLAGTITFSDDPVGGFLEGDSADFDFDVVSLGGPWTGSIVGTYTVDSESQVSVTGNVDFRNGPEGCNSSFDIPSTSPLVVQDLRVVAPVLAANFFGIEIFGALETLVEAGGHELEGLISIVQGSQGALVDAAYDGIELDPFTIELIPPLEEIEALVTCLFSQGEGLFFALDTLLRVIEQVESPGTHPDIQITPTGINSFDFLVSPSIAGTVADSLSGSVVAALPPAASSVTWTMTLASEGLQGNSVGPWSVVLPAQEGGAVRVSGATEFTSAMGDCETTVTIPASDPIVFEPPAEDPTSGVLRLLTTQGGNELRATYDLGAEGGPAFTALSLNGIPLPPSLLDG